MCWSLAFLCACPFKVAFAADGRKGLEMIREMVPDLLLLDLLLPGIEGMEIRRIVRSDDVLTDVSIVMLTAAARGATCSSV